MPTLILMRHANAELPAVGMRDFDRPVSMRGRAEVAITSKLLQTVDLEISKIYCSPARRTLETLAYLQEMISLHDTPIKNFHELYSGDVFAYQNLLISLSANDICLMIGHNPMIEQFALSLAKTGDQQAMHHLRAGFTTGAIAIIELKPDFDRHNPFGELQYFLEPKTA